jgi:hypothetical protein
MSDPHEERVPKTQPVFSGLPPRPPKVTARGLQGESPDDSRKTVFLPDPVSVRDLASALQLKVFKIVADLMELKLFKRPDDDVDFETATLIARKHGYRAERPPPGVLVL